MSSDDGRDLERHLEALYALPLESFVTERKRVADEMKRAGDRAGAAAIAKAAKPALSAWVVNQLARGEREAVRRLAKASADVRRAQLEMVSGRAGREAFAAATGAQREGLATLRTAAEAILAGGGHATTPAVLERVARNLRAMIGSEAAAAQIEAGRLVDDVTMGEGLGDFAALAASLPSGADQRTGRTERTKGTETAERVPGAAAPSPDAPPAHARDDARMKAAARAEAQRRKQEEAERAKELTRLRRAVEDAEGRARTAAKAAERARRSSDDAAEEAARAEAEVTEARRALDEAQARPS